MSSQPEKRVELWLPTGDMKVSVVDGEVRIWDEMVMKKRLIQKPAGFAQREGETDSVEHPA